MADIKYLTYEGLQYLVNKIKMHAIAERITYNDLVIKRNNGELQFGKYYMITDYVTIVNNTGKYMSIGEGFAIIVLATGERTLSEEAFAYDNSNEEGYFRVNNAKLNAWKLWYCLDNDTNRFEWASGDGKGVIYRMIDEHGNDCPYDFKNIKFRRFKLNPPMTPTTGRPFVTRLYNNIMEHFSNNRLSYIWAGTYDVGSTGTYSWDVNKSVYSKPGGGSKFFFTFSNIISIDNDIIHDSSITTNYCKNNVIKTYYRGNKFLLNDIVFFNISGDSSCYNNSFDVGCHSNSFGNNFYNNIFGAGCNTNTFGINCYNNTFSSGCYLNNFGNSCSQNSFGNNCYTNSFMGYCMQNSFGNNCYYNSFGSVNNNIFGNGCFNNNISDKCAHNIFGNNCSNNNIDTGSCFNIFMNYCNGNSLSTSCYYNSFGNNCVSNSLSTGCYSNSFGNNCYGNNLGNNNSYNSFGNHCYYNSFRMADRELSSLRGYCYYNHFDNGCSYNVIWNNDTSSASDILQNVHIKRGVIGDSNNYNYINITTLNNGYCTTIAKTSSNELLIYCEDDYLSNDEIDTIF